MPPFEGPKLSVGERAAAQNKKGAAEAANIVKHANARAKVVKALNDMGIKHNPDAPTKNLIDVLEANTGVSDNVPMAGKQGDFILSKGAVRAKRVEKKRGKAIGGPVGYSQRWKTGRKG